MTYRASSYVSAQNTHGIVEAFMGFIQKRSEKLEKAVKSVALIAYPV